MEITSMIIDGEDNEFEGFFLASPALKLTHQIAVVSHPR